MIHVRAEPPADEVYGQPTPYAIKTHAQEDEAAEQALDMLEAFIRERRWPTCMMQPMKTVIVESKIGRTASIYPFDDNWRRVIV
jgi:hypothetical protein